MEKNPIVINIIMTATQGNTLFFFVVKQEVAGK